jgi:hypothetical protein
MGQDIDPSLVITIVVGDKCPVLERETERETRALVQSGRLLLHNLPTNHADGGAAARNHALLHLLPDSVEYITFLDDDNLYLLRHLSTLHRTLTTPPSVSLSLSSIVMSPFILNCTKPRKYRVDTSSFMVARSELLALAGGREEERGGEEEREREREREGETGVIWKGHSTGGYAHDWDLIRRLLERGIEWRVTGEATLWYRVHGGSLNNPRGLVEVYEDD